MVIVSAVLLAGAASIVAREVIARELRTTVARRLQPSVSVSWQPAPFGKGRPAVKHSSSARAGDDVDGSAHGPALLAAGAGERRAHLVDARRQAMEFERRCPRRLVALERDFAAAVEIVRLGDEGDGSVLRIDFDHRAHDEVRRRERYG